MKIKKIISLILLILMVINPIAKVVNAVEINSSYIENLGDCGYHLQYKNQNTGVWTYVITTMAGYKTDGTTHYAYCLNVEKQGVAESGNYTVNVNELLSDVRIWRAIINGFPYKTPNELGVSNEQDAFVATKQAVYSVLHDRNVDDFYRGGDERGTRIFNAIKNIVNIARYGSQTPTTNGLLKTNKIGEFKKDGENYYSQEYSVSSNADISNYSVTSIADFPEGSFVADVNGNAKITFSERENFKVLIPKNKIVNNFKGKISLNGTVKTYPVFLGKSPNNNWQDYALTYYAYTTANAETHLSVNAYKSQIKIIKVDAETKKTLEGVKFDFRYKNGEYIGSYTTDLNGVITLDNLKQGEIIASEVNTLEEYELSTEEKEITLDYDIAITTTIENEHKRGNLKIYKVDSDNNKIALGGVEFALYSYEFDEIIGHYTTDANGEIFIENLRTGNWALIEEKTNKWYNLANSVDIKVEWNEVNNTTIKNELKKSKVRVIKVDKDNSEIKLANVTFQVMDEIGNVLETITTNKDGEAITSYYAVRDYEKLYFKEISTNENYVLDDSIHMVELKENEIVNVKFENEKKKEIVQTEKVIKKLPKTGY